MGKKNRPSPGMRRAAGTNDAVESILADVNQLGREMTVIPHAAENAARLRNGKPALWPSSMVEFLGAEKYEAVVDTVARFALVDLWRKQGRVAYDIHPEMASSLYRSDLKGKIPGSLFKRLRHINPLIPLPHPWPFRDSDGVEGLIRGYFITGSRNGAFCPTTDKQSENLLLVPWIEFSETEPGVRDVGTPLIALPDTNGMVTFADIMANTHKWNGTKQTKDDTFLFKQLIPGALTMLSYFCCKNADIQEPPPVASTKGKRKSGPLRDPYYVRVGWYVGPKLHDARVRANGRVRDGGVSSPSGVEYGPQHRVGHSKTVWVGPGRMKDESIWVDPYWTKLDLKQEMLDNGQDPVTQVVPVDHQRGDSSSRRDIRRANLGTKKSKEILKRERQLRREKGWEF